jgi:Proton-conducting membrane transporter
VGHSGRPGLVGVVVERMGEIAKMANALPALPALLAALLAAALPVTDRMAMRRMGLLAAILTGVWTTLVVVRGANPSLIPATIALVVGFPVAFRAGAPRVPAADSRVYGVCSNLWFAIMVCALLVPSQARLALSVALVPWFVLVLWLGGPRRGSATVRSLGLFWVADGLGFWAATATGLPIPVRACLSWLPGLARCSVGPFGLWQQPVQDHSPMVAIAFGWLQLPVAFTFWLGWYNAIPFLHPILPPLLILVAITAALMSVAERDLRRLIGHAVGTMVPLYLLSIGYGDRVGQMAALVGIAGVALLAVCATALIEAIERRTESRDAFVLAGLVQQQPFLAVAFAVCLLLMVGPTGGGCVLWSVLHLNDGAAAGSWPIMPITVLTYTVVGTQIALRRWWWTPTAHQRIQERMSFQQTIRVLLPVAASVVIVIAGMAMIPVLAR